MGLDVLATSSLYTEKPPSRLLTRGRSIPLLRWAIREPRLRLTNSLMRATTLEFFSVVAVKAKYLIAFGVSLLL